MVFVTAANFKAIYADVIVNDERVEALIDQAVNVLNLFGADLANMVGTAGSKTLSLESSEAGAVYLLAYYIFHSNPKTVSSGGGSVSGGYGSDIMQEARRLARRISELEVSVG